MATIWVLTQPTGGNLTQEIVRADVITSVSGNSDNVLAVRSDTRELVSLAWGSSAGKPRPLPAGFHVYFLQVMDEVQRDKGNLDKLVLAKWGIDQGEWQWLVMDIEDLAPREF
ncbi:hypothetical protein OG369_41775 [Streptomyces sp. NBC_01221]|uniref:hypothetical protein n=1 Tax=Streptomyces sp. NBC_01221 TaxID=2903782 RepID=UPI002254F07E|nr:hypothetical protein [Streptomyces sp. NBC_01221]MCX4792021.1 hypothetical protein [Streptomyces sp. NBC_01221]MCX4792330.1 hypothetical protein [Streptomyces sp. NBC_01221]